MYDGDDYVFEDDYGGGDGDDGEETWETQIENDYADARSYADTNLEEAVRRYEQVIKDDQDKGKWTFKALKGIFRACAKHRDEARMLEYYEKALNFQWPTRTRSDVEKMINKFIDRTSSFPRETLRAIYATTMSVISKEQKNFDKLWFSIRLRMAQMMLTERRFEELEREIESMHVWCKEGEQAELRKASQQLSVLALEIQLRTELNDAAKIRAVYEAAMNIKCAITPPRVMGILRESGGKMFLRQSMWQEAHECFMSAFRNFDEAGDPRRIACLKYLILSTMLSEAQINPFDSNEAKSYQNDPEIVAMTQLISAAQKNDIKTFDQVLRDKQRSRSILEDPFIFSYLEPLIIKVRAQALYSLVKPYRRVRLEYIARQLMIQPAEAESLCATAIVDGQLRGRIDQLAGILLLSPSKQASTTAALPPAADSEDAAPLPERSELLSQLVSKTFALHRIVAKNAITTC